jgi:hypothetical protein
MPASLPQREIKRFMPKLIVNPNNNPEPTLTPAEAGTFHKTVFLRAPPAATICSNVRKWTVQAKIEQTECSLRRYA